MTTILLIISGTGLALTAAVLAIVVAGIRREPSELSTRAPGLGAGLVRRPLGLYVRRPDRESCTEEHKECLTGIRR
jgi:hypothetical protein